MKKLLMLVGLGIAAVVGAEEVKFNRKVWYGLEDKADRQAERELAIVLEGYSYTTEWEAGKGVSYFREVGSGEFAKYDFDGRMVKVSAETNFPELVKLKVRKVELRKQLKEEYAKSLGVTVEEIETALNTPHEKTHRVELELLKETLMRQGKERQNRLLDEEDNRVNAELKKLREARENADPK